MLTNKAFMFAIGLQLAAGALLAAAPPPATTPGWMTRPAVGTSKRDAREARARAQAQRPLAWGNAAPPQRSRRPAPARRAGPGPVTIANSKPAAGPGSVTVADPKPAAASLAPAAAAAAAVVAPAQAPAQAATPPSLPVPAAERSPYAIRGLELPGLATPEERAALPAILTEMRALALARPPRPARIFWREKSVRPALPENADEGAAKPEKAR